MQASDMIDTVRGNTRKYEQGLRKAEERLSASGEQSLRLQHAITAALGKIAALHLDGNVSLDADIRRQLELRRDEEASLRDQLAGVEEQIANTIREVQASDKAVRSAVAALQAKLRQSPDYVQLESRHAAAVTELSAAQGKYDEIRAECDGKLAKYEESRLYTYLRSVGYGEATYHRTGIFRAMDGWIADLCSFATNRPNERLLQAMRQSNEESHANLSAAVANLSDQIDTLNKAAEAKSPLPKLKGEQTVHTKLLAANKQRANAIHEDLEKFAAKTDARYIRTKEMLAGRLQESSLDHLMARIRETANPEDDAIVDEVIRLRAELAKARDEYRICKEEHTLAQEDYERAKGLERSLRTRRYVNDDYEYDRSLNLDSLLAGYMAGRIDSRQVTRTVESSQVEVPRYSAPVSPSGGWGGFGDSGGSSLSPSSDSFSTTDSF